MNLYIFGAGHGADEILEDSNYFLDGNELKFENTFLVEDEPSKKDIIPTLAMLGISAYSHPYGIISAWSPRWKDKLDSLSIQWVSAISDYADIKLDTLPIGLNARSGAIVSRNTKIGRHVRLNFKSCVAMDASVGNYCFLAIGATMLGYSSLGDGSILYSGSVILPGVKVGSNTVIGAGSVVTKDIGDNVIAYGNPCKVVRSNLYDGSAVEEND